MSAWIETFTTVISGGVQKVALRVSAWIETFYLVYEQDRVYVALRVSAWIETKRITAKRQQSFGRAPCERVD